MNLKDLKILVKNQILCTSIATPRSLHESPPPSCPEEKSESVSYNCSYISQAQVALATYAIFSNKMSRIPRPNLIVWNVFRNNR